MNYWHQISMVRLVIAFIIGIVIALILGLPVHISLYISVSLFLIYTAFVFWSRLYSNYKYRWLHGFIITISLILLGFECTMQNTEKFQPNHIGNYISDTNTVVIGVLNESLNERDNSYSSILKVKSVFYNNKWNNARGNIMLYFAKDSITKMLEYGDKIIIDAKISEVKPPQNPNEFDYKKYLSNKSIYHQAFIKSSCLKVIDNNEGNPIIANSLILQSKLLKILKDNHIEGNEYAVAAAMLLGSRDKIDADLISAYSGSGAVHILSVSGLHVGLVFLLLNYLLFFMDKNKYLKLFKIVILLLFIWFYAAITGFSSAVLRSTAMFTFIVIGQAYNRKINGFNTLAASLFFLLIINPYLITDVGFQLSYLAVIGIMFIYQPIYKLWKPNYWILDKIWALICVSIAAQLTTGPLALFYFHQFPNLFIVTNLLIIPLTTLIMYIGMGFYIVSFIPIVSVGFSKLLTFLIYLLNEIVKFIEHLPFAVSRNIHITKIELFLLLLTIILLIVFFYSKQKKFLFIAFLFAIFMAISNIIDKFNALHHQKFIVYNINHHAAYDFIDGQSNYLIADSMLLHDKQKLSFHITNNWCNLEIKKNNLITLADTILFQLKNTGNEQIQIKNNYIQFHNKLIAIINNYNCNLISNQKLNTDFLILSGNVKVNIKSLMEQYNCKQIIIDSSNSLWRTNKWLDECKELNIDAYAVNYSGAFELDL